MTKKINFENAFGDNGVSCRGVCDCGKEFYNSDNGWDFEDGELEALYDAKATDCEYAIRLIVFENKELVDQCGCWGNRANILMNFIDTHSRQIAEYLNSERARKVDIIESTPIVKIDEN